MINDSTTLEKLSKEVVVNIIDIVDKIKEEIEFKQIEFNNINLVGKYDSYTELCDIHRDLYEIYFYYFICPDRAEYIGGGISDHRDSNNPE